MTNTTMTNTNTTASTEAPVSLRTRYESIRNFTAQLCAPLSAEDCAIQSMPDVSPTRWHLAHTTWFFETFVLAELPDYQSFKPEFEYLFNSYYNAVGAQFPRSNRGLLSRPGLDEIWEYRQQVDRQMSRFLAECNDDRLLQIVELGIQHEQQHQELMLTDIKHVLSCNPLFPAYIDCPTTSSPSTEPISWHNFDEGLYLIGHDGDAFAYDNESPRHRVFVEDFSLANRVVNCGEYLQFIDDHGYQRPELWLSAGWQTVCEQQWHAPLYWQLRDGEWHQFTLAGLRPLEPAEPVCHVSYFEADAFARWSAARLPTEAEWEIAGEGIEIVGNFAEQYITDGKPPHPAATTATDEQSLPMFGDVWQWTASPYTAYPKYQAPDGALGEYNGKFMCNQYVLRGGSCATSLSHIRRTYRNFFPPDARWQFTGLRLARDYLRLSAHSI